MKTSSVKWFWFAIALACTAIWNIPMVLLHTSLWVEIGLSVCVFAIVYLTGGLCMAAGKNSQE
jgi:RsiW-degrading membrane proteinase PrsW (M82 family)